MRRRIAAAGATGILLLSLTACTTGAPMSNPAPSSRPPFATSTRGPIAPSGTPAEVSTARWDAILGDLAGRNVGGEPELVSAESVTWPNGALGCPKPGNSYTQAVVEGLRVVVKADDTTYDYRFGRGDAPTLCDR